MSGMSTSTLDALNSAAPAASAADWYVSPEGSVMTLGRSAT
jgi:hypothetical protein